jgi:hypothetical protein
MFRLKHMHRHTDEIKQNFTPFGSCNQSDDGCALVERCSCYCLGNKLLLLSQYTKHYLTCRNYVNVSTPTLFQSKSFSVWVPMSQSLDTNANLAIRPKTTISSMLTFRAVIHKDKWCINFSLLLVFLNTVNTADAQSRYISCCPSCFSTRVRIIVRNKNTFDLASSDSEFCTSCI